MTFLTRLFAPVPPFISRVLHGEGLAARAMRSSTWAVGGYGGSQVIRLASNLILTRLLFPEAFGLMAIILVFMMGLAMFSDIGVSPAIQQSKRGDDPDFLDTAWTIQVCRGVMLWLATCALAGPISWFYAEPMLMQMIPVAGLSLLVTGLNPTRVHTAGRHLQIGRLTILEMVSQVIGVIVMVALAWQFRSVWALLAGMLLTSVAKLLLTLFLLEGHRNRFRWEASAGKDLIHFGKWIFFSTICGFLVNQGDRAILGKYLTTDLLGIYSIGYFLASFPLQLGNTVVFRVLIPLYREKPPAASRSNFLRLRKMRFLVTGGLMFLTLLMAWAGPGLVNFLYDPRYVAAGGIAVLISFIVMLQIIVLTYDRAALAAGDSKSFFYLVAFRAVIQTAFFLIGAELAGLPGALVGQLLSVLMAYPMFVWLARRHKAWDPLHDAVFALIGLCFGLLILWYNWNAVTSLLGLGMK